MIDGKGSSQPVPQVREELRDEEGGKEELERGGSAWEREREGSLQSQLRKVTKMC